MFKKYPLIRYPFKTDSVTIEKILKDITVSLKVKSDVVELSGFFSEYILRDGDTPEVVAWKFYGDAKLHYLVMLSNARYDWRKDFPLTQPELDAYVMDAYANPNGIHHYVDTKTGDIVETEGEFTVPITNMEFEYSENEKKRPIRLIRPEYVSDVVNALNGLLEG